MSNLQNTNNDVYQQLMDMNKSFSGGGGGMGGGLGDSTLPDCESLPKDKPEYLTCQEEKQRLINASHDSAFAPGSQNRTDYTGPQRPSASRVTSPRP
jgi:hypothetical protein